MKALLPVLFCIFVLHCGRDEKNSQSLDGTLWLKAEDGDTLVLGFQMETYSKWAYSFCYQEILSTQYEVDDGLFYSSEGVFSYTLTENFLVLEKDDVSETWLRTDQVFDFCNDAEYGWMAFRDHDWNGAHTIFLSACNAFPEDAYTGLGWVSIKLDSLDRSYYYFDIVADDSILDAYSGWALSSWAAGNYSLCIDASNFVLSKDPTYLFFHSLSYNYRDVLWLKASAHYHLGDLASCILAIKQIDPHWLEPILSDPNIEVILLAKLELLWETLNPAGG